MVLVIFVGMRVGMGVRMIVCFTVVVTRSMLMLVRVSMLVLVFRRMTVLMVVAVFMFVVMGADAHAVLSR